MRSEQNEAVHKTMSRRNALTAALYLPTLLVVVIGVRAVWLRYLRTLSESELHLRVFEQIAMEQLPFRMKEPRLRNPDEFIVGDLFR